MDDGYEGIVKNEREQVIYLGPSILALGLLRNTVFIGGLPERITAAIGKYPEIERLTAYVPDYVAARERINRKGTQEHLAFTALQKRLNRRDK